MVVVGRADACPAEEGSQGHREGAYQLAVGMEACQPEAYQLEESDILVEGTHRVECYSSVIDSARRIYWKHLRRHHAGSTKGRDCIRRCKRRRRTWRDTGRDTRG